MHKKKATQVTAQGSKVCAIVYFTIEYWFGPPKVPGDPTNRHNVLLKAILRDCKHSGSSAKVSFKKNRLCRFFEKEFHILADNQVFRFVAERGSKPYAYL